MSRQRGERDASQQRLPFEAGNGVYEEERSLLGLALLRVSADLHLAQFMLWLFNTTEAGAKGALKKSYKQLAAQPWGLCCSEKKARGTVRAAKRHRLVHVEETWTAEGIQGANLYRYDRELIRAAVGLRTPVPTDQAPVPTDQAPVPTDQAHIRNNTFSHLSTPFHTSIDRSNGRPKVQMLSPEERREQISVAIERSGAWQVAELREVRERRIAPLPPEILLLDALAPLKTVHLTSVIALTRWFRRQLSIPEPFTGDSQAELLLVLAAGIATAAIPEREIRKDRMAIFKATLSRGIWKTVLWHVPTAKRELDKLLCAFPECLTNEGWPGPRTGGDNAPFSNEEVQHA